MQCSVVSYLKLKEHGDWRWDSEYFCNEPHYNKNLFYQPIGQIIVSSQYGISIDMNEDGEGTKIYRMNEISDMFCDRTISKYANIPPSQINKFKLRNNDALFNRTNSQEFVGRTGIFRKFTDEAIVFASYLIRVKTNEEEVFPEYLTAFLNTKYGMQDAKRRARISINQSNINAEELKRIMIPILKKPIQEIIRNLFDLSFTLINKSETFYQQAEQIILSELGLLDWQPQHMLSFIRNYSETQSSGRIDAEYYQPVYDEIIEKVKHYKNGYETINGCMKIKDKNFIPIADTIYKYIELANISANGHINGFIEAEGKELPTRARFKVKTGDVIVSSIEGALSSIALINAQLNNALCSTGFFVVKSYSINSETLLVLLKSPVGQLQLKKGCSGTILTAISKDEFKRIVLPKIDLSVQKSIKINIDEMYNTKKRSLHLLEIAKRGVEMAIEMDEKTARNWMESEIKGLDSSLRWNGDKLDSVS